MKIIVTSRNPVKVDAVRDTFSKRFPGNKLEICSLAVESGVADQPMSDEETRRGARNRVRAARHMEATADFWVGLEGGLERVDGQLLASAWMVVEDRAGRRGEARSCTLPLPPAVMALVDSGLELGEANDRVFRTSNSKQAGGAFGLFTDQRMTRQGIYAQTLDLALVPLLSELWPAG